MDATTAVNLNLVINMVLGAVILMSILHGLSTLADRDSDSVETLLSFILAIVAFIAITMARFNIF